MVSSSEREESANGDGRDVYVTLIQTDTVNRKSKHPLTTHTTTHFHLSPPQNVNLNNI